MHPKPEHFQIGSMTWVDYDHYVSDYNPVVLIPVGSTEQHGPHSPLGCDAIVGTEIAHAVAPKIGALVAPAIAYGYTSQPRTGAGNHYPGNLSIDGETLTSLVTDIVRSFAAHGVRRICLLSSHFENHWFIIEGIQEALDLLRRDGNIDVKVICMSYFELGSPEICNKVFGDQFISWEVEHGAVMTTSILMHRRPDLVDTSAIPDHQPIILPPYDVFPFDPERGSKSGAMSASTIATAANGKLFFDDFTRNISCALAGEFNLSEGINA